MNRDLKVRDMNDTELMDVVDVCNGMFTVHKLSSQSLTSFAEVLRKKFSEMRGEQIIKFCTDTAADPPKHDIRFTPTFLASILKSFSRSSTPFVPYAEREPSTEQKIKYRQEFLKDVAQIFEAHKHGEQIKYFFAWQYVAELLVRADYAERLPKIAEEKVKRDFSQVTDVFSSYKPFVLECFDRMIKNNQHISDVIHGIN